MFLLLIAAVLISLNPALSPVYAQSSEIEYLRSEAANSRAFAEKRRNHAKQWQDNAEEARRRAKKSKKKIDKDSYLDDARRYDERAEAAAIDADKAEAQATKAEAELLQVLKTLEQGPTEATDTSPPSETATKTKNSSPAIPIEDVIGVWKIEEKDSVFVIVQEDRGSSAYKLEAHTGPRIWKGWYTPFDEGHVSRLQDARVVFKYTPKAKEMNPDIPKWARKKIEGQLEWEIELNEPQTCGGDPTLDGKFFPGRVKWDEKDKTVKIDGRGEPRDMTLALQLYDPLEAYVRTAISIRPPGLGGKSDDDKTGELLPFAPLSVLVEGQLFHVDVSLPYEVAKKQGEKLKIKLRGLSSGGSEKVELIRGAFRRGRPAKYTNYRPLFFGDSKPFLSQSWQDEVGDHAQRVDLDLENGESVAIGVEKTFEIVPVYKDMEEYTIAKYMEAAGYLNKLYNIRMVAPGASKKQKEDAHVRLLRLKNFGIIMNNPENPKWLRVLIAKEYLGPVMEISQIALDPKKIHGAGQVRVSNVNIEVRRKNGFADDTWSNALTDHERVGDNDKEGRFDGIIWSNNYERHRVIRLIGSAWREKVHKAFDTFMVDLTFGLYEWALSEMSVGYGRFRIGVSDLYALISDEDHYGRKLPKGKKVEIIGNLMLSHLTDYASDELRDGMIDEIAGYQAPGDKLLTIKDVTQAVRGRNVQKHKVKLIRPKGAQKKPDLPDTMNKKQKESAAPILATHNEGINLTKPVSCAPPRAQSGTADGGDSIGKAITIAKRYGEDAVIVKHDAPDARQEKFGTCQIDAVLHAADVEMNPISVLRLMAENSPEFAQRLKNTSRENHPLIRGFTEAETELLANLLGRKTKGIPGGKNMSMKILKGLRENGWSIKVSIHADDYTGSGDNKHSVDVVGFEQDPKGCGLTVTVHDKDLGVTVTMPAKDLQAKMAEWPIMLHREQDGGVTPKKLAQNDDGSPPPRSKIKVDEFDDLPRRTPPKADEFDPSADIPTIHEVVDYLHPGGKDAPPMNVVSRDIHRKLLNGANWEQPKEGGASFSPPGVGTLRAGDIAISVREGSEQHIRWEKHEGGLVPNYTPPTGPFAGKQKSYIHPEHLQYLDPSKPGEPKWRPYPPGRNPPTSEGQ